MPPTLYLIQIILQALSSLAIAGGLIFTAIQFRNARRAQDVANFSKLVEMQMHLREMRVSDPSLANVYQDDVADLHSDQEVREYFLNLMQMSVFEIVWYAHRQGQLADDYFDSWVNRMEAIESEPSFQKMYRSKAMKIHHDDFQAFVRALVEKSERARAAAKGYMVTSPPPSR